MALFIDFKDLKTLKKIFGFFLNNNKSENFCEIIVSNSINRPTFFYCNQKRLWLAVLSCTC